MPRTPRTPRSPGSTEALHEEVVRLAKGGRP